MSRRSGQTGRIEKHGKFWTVRFWLDVPGQVERDYKRVKICPVSGAGSLNKFELKRRSKEIIAEFGANSDATLREAEALNLGTGDFSPVVVHQLYDSFMRNRLMVYLR